MRSEILISIPEVATTSARASMQRCLASYSPANKWFDATTGIKHAGFNHTPLCGPGGSS